MSKNVAILNDNKVINIIIVNDDYILNVDEIFYTDLNPAFIGGYYLENVFIYPQCHAEAVLNIETANWNCSNSDHDPIFK
jgi:hypothetical protein